MKSRDLDTLTANRGLQKALTFADIDYDIALQPRIKLPDRRALVLWNSFDLAHFRAARRPGKIGNLSLIHI